ncbi:hypothetical protein [Gordonia soli]|uniref:Uncharacterized protein n=1 Tax=Gordonia soli NBRC 108243 TaxID=1223545 RepID=M0QQW1_9ACTN|nr:hypothetical protein [Gordonia soli]GAC71065.1 hypothetical protein GS4_51_00030 [Gordonia soli NBRC 108243]
MSTGRDIVADIDALIDDQLAAGEDGQTARADNVDRPCGHCGRPWHGLAVTRRLEEMRLEYGRRRDAAGDRGEEPEYATSAILDGYRYDEDDSDILCPGSEFIGPVPPTFEPYRCTCFACAVDRMVNPFRDSVGLFQQQPSPWARRWELPPFDWSAWIGPATNSANARWWRLDNPPTDFDYEIIDDREEFDAFAAPGYRAFAPARRWLMVRNRETLAMEKVELFDDGNGTNLVYRYDGVDRLTAVEIYTYWPPRLGGKWVPITAPGGRRTSTSLIPTRWLCRILDDAGLWFLAPRELRAVRDRLRGLVGRVGMVPGAPYFVGRDFNLGTGIRFGWDRGDGRILTGTIVGDVETDEHGNTTFSLQPDGIDR